MRVLGYGGRDGTIQPFRGVGWGGVGGLSLYICYQNLYKVITPLAMESLLTKEIQMKHHSVRVIPKAKTPYVKPAQSLQDVMRFKLDFMLMMQHCGRDDMANASLQGLRNAIDQLDSSILFKE